MNLRHFATVNSQYDFVDVESEGENVEYWTYLVYINKALSQGIEIEFKIQHEPEVDVELIRATTVIYGEIVEPCPICGTTVMEVCPEFEAEKDFYDKEHAFLHLCKLNGDDLLDLVTEIYMDDNFEDILTQEVFDESFIIERIEDTRIYLLSVEDAQRFVVKKNAVYHLRKHDESEDECTFCESKEFNMYDEEGIWQKCSVLSKNIRTLKKLIRKSNQRPKKLS